MEAQWKKWGFKGNFEIAFAPCDVWEVEATIAMQTAICHQEAFAHF